MFVFVGIGITWESLLGFYGEEENSTNYQRCPQSFNFDYLIEPIYESVFVVMVINIS